MFFLIELLLLAVLPCQTEDDCLVVATLVGLAADRVAELVLAQVAQYAALHLAVVVGHAAEGLLGILGVLADSHIRFHKNPPLLKVNKFIYSYFAQNKLLFVEGLPAVEIIPVCCFKVAVPDEQFADSSL